MYERSWVRIPAPNTGHFFTLICCKNCNDICLKRPKINEKEAGVFLKKVAALEAEMNGDWSSTKGKSFGRAQ